MNLRLAKLFLIAIPVLLTAFSWPNKPGSGGNPKLLANKSLSTAETILTFKDFQIISVKNNEVQLKAITDNAGVKQVTNITVNIDGGNLSFAIVVLPNDRNVELKLTPGNWEIGLNRADELTVYSIVKDEPAKVVESEDDYRLFAASKDLYNALALLLDNWHSNSANFLIKEPLHIKEARKAIAKANPNYKP